LQKDINTLCAVVDCTPIRPGGSCYNPNTVADHASYVFNSYFRARQSAPSTCNFGGDALLVVNNPSSGSCIYP
ncbi:Glucan endo-1,3-beta-glucosidase, partial [Ananas comosus]